MQVIAGIVDEWQGMEYESRRVKFEDVKDLSARASLDESCEVSFDVTAIAASITNPKPPP